MEVRFISQYAGENSHYESICSLLESNLFNHFKCLTAFVTIGGILSFEQPLRNFLINENRLEWILGIDNGITSKEALSYLRGLKLEFNNLVDIKVFSAGSNQYIFHPKLYSFENEEKCVLITGSANATSGGLLSNFELSMVATFTKDSLEGTQTYQQFNEVWDQYATPNHPLEASNLLDILSPEITELLNSGETRIETSAEGRHQRRRHPLRGNSKGKELAQIIREKYGNRSVTRAGIQDQEIVFDQEHETILPDILIMDILTETRGTQVQLPKAIINRYFPNQQENHLYFNNGESVTFEDIRPIVILEHNDTRRIEIREIRGVARPLIIRFNRIPEFINRYIYELIDTGHPEFDQLDILLDTEGHQSRAGSRRWIIQ